MSFILDALKKVDAQRGPSGDAASSRAMDLDALYRERLRRRRQLTSMAVIALLSAGATAVAIHLLSTRAAEPARESVDASAGTVPAAVDDPGAAEVEGETSPSDLASTPPESPVAEISESGPEPSGGSLRKTASRGSSREPAAQTPAGARASAGPGPGGAASAPPPIDAPAGVPTRSEVREASSAPPSVSAASADKPLAADVSESSSPSAEAPAPDGAATEEASGPPEDVPGDPSTPGSIRLVGQASQERSASEASDRRAARPEGEEEPLPEHFPKLVLQGTSVIDGSPVAVISDRRVFEGDTIDGARVVRIEERAVTLEFEGRRFTLTL